jgi:hypothetical protein
MVATLFELDELVAASRSAGFAITPAEQRPPYASEHEAAGARRTRRSAADTGRGRMSETDARGYRSS